MCLNTMTIQCLYLLLYRRQKSVLVLVSLSVWITPTNPVFIFGMQTTPSQTWSRQKIYKVNILGSFVIVNWSEERVDLEVRFSHWPYFITSCDTENRSSQSIYLLQGWNCKMMLHNIWSWNDAAVFAIFFSVLIFMEYYM